MKRLFCSPWGKGFALTLAALVAGGVAMAGDPQIALVRSSSPQTGVASYYGAKYHGRLTANGEVFDMHALTAAHPKFKFGTKVKVTHLANNRAVVVRINDRGPFVKGRVIDLSQAAAAELQMIRSGLAEVKIEIVE